MADVTPTPKLKSDVILEQQYLQAVSEYGQAIYQRDQLNERIGTLRARIDQLNAAQPVCNAIEKELVPLAVPAQQHTEEAPTP